MTKREIPSSFAELVLPGFGDLDLGIPWSLGF